MDSLLATFIILQVAFDIAMALYLFYDKEER